MTSCVCNCAVYRFQAYGILVTFITGFIIQHLSANAKWFSWRNPFFALFCEKLIKKPCLLIVQNQFHGMFARFDADIAVISAVFAVQGPGNLLVGLDDDAVGLERIDEVCVILLHQQGRNDLIQFQRVFRAFDQGYLEESIIQAYILSRQVLKPPTDLAFVTIP